MPFTLAHPAAAIPLCRRLGRFGVLSALVIGSITPDLHYFLPLAIGRDEAHSLAGLFWFDLPIGFAVYLVFHLFLKLPLLSLFPPSLAGQAGSLVLLKSPLPKVSWIAVFISLFVGVATHLIWDSFTHSGAVGVRAVPLLQTPLFSVSGYNVRAYHALQQISTVGGLILLGSWFKQWQCSTAAQHWRQSVLLSERERSVILGSLIVAASVFALLSVMGMIPASLTIFTARDALKTVVVTAISALCLFFFAYSVIWQVFAFWKQ
ncbi:MAG: DUF4184 family protein [Pseudomonadota bacterium]